MVTALPGDGSAAVSWTEPSDTAGGVISYAIYAVEMGERMTVPGNTLSVVFPNLTQESIRTFRVTATGAGGVSAPSMPSAPITIAGCLAGVSCAGRCVDTRTDGENCGACAVSCGGAACQNSACGSLTLASAQYFPKLVAVNRSGVFFVDGENVFVKRVAIDGGAVSVAFQADAGVTRIEAFGPDRLLVEAGRNLLLVSTDGGVATNLTNRLRPRQWSLTDGGVVWLVPPVGCTAGAPLSIQCPAAGASCDPAKPTLYSSGANFYDCSCPPTSCGTAGTLVEWTATGSVVVANDPGLSLAVAFTNGADARYLGLNRAGSNYVREYELMRWAPGQQMLNLSYGRAFFLPETDLWVSGDFVYFTDHRLPNNSSAGVSYSRVRKTGGLTEQVVGGLKLVDVNTTASGTVYLTLGSGAISRLELDAGLTSATTWCAAPDCSAAALYLSDLYVVSATRGTVTRTSIP